MKKSRLLSFLLSVTMLFGLASCGEIISGPQGVPGEPGIQGPAGDSGHTPYIGSNGNWWINNEDTGIKAEGEKGDKGDPGKDGINGENGHNGLNGHDGDTPYIGEDGNWWIGQQNTHIPATGDKGEQGIPGQDGVSIISITKTKSEENIDTYKILYSDGTESFFTVTNGINGQDGKPGEAGPQGEKGEPGLNGHDGAIGPQGPQGEIGPEGKPGKDGNDGQDGKPGEVGPKGDKGDTGAQGPQGEKGEQGIQGIPGKDGHTPTIKIGENGNWFVDGVDTNIKAQGPAGENGTTKDFYSGFKGKKLSIIGDSISTFRGAIPAGYANHYPSQDVQDINDTWWMKLSNTLGTDLLVNASWSGSCVTNARNTFNNNNASCSSSNKRIEDLSKDGVNPDIVVIYMGINDFTSGAKVRGWDGSEFTTDTMVQNHAKANGGKFYFDDAYALMVTKILEKYPNVELYCNTICEKRDLKPNALVPYNNAIKYIGNTLGAKVIDLHSCGITHYNLYNYMGDGLHPNKKGVEKFYKCMLNSIAYNSCYSYDPSVDNNLNNKKAKVNILDTQNGTVKANKLEGLVGEEITLKITPNSGYRIDSIFVNEKQVSNSEIINFNLVQGINNIKVTFKLKDIPSPVPGDSVDLNSLELKHCNTPETIDPYKNESLLIYKKEDKSIRTNPKFSDSYIWNVMSYLTTPIKVGEEIEIQNVSLKNIKGLAINVMNKENITNPTLNPNQYAYWAKTNIFGFYATYNEPTVRWDAVGKDANLKIDPSLEYESDNLHTIRLVLARGGLNGVDLYIDGVKCKIPDTSKDQDAEELLLNTNYYIAIRATKRNSDLVGNISYMGKVRSDINENLYTHPMLYKKSGSNKDKITGFYNNSGVWTDSDGTSTSSIGPIEVKDGETYLIDRGVHEKDYWVHYMVDGVWYKQDDSVSASPNKITVPINKGINSIVIGGYGDIESFKTFKVTKEVKTTFYIDQRTSCKFSLKSIPTSGAFAYSLSLIKETMLNKPVNFISLRVAQTGTLTYGIASESTLKPLGTLNLKNPSNKIDQIFKIPTITLREGETIYVHNASDTGKFYYSDISGTKYDNFYNHLNGNFKLSTSVLSNYNLGISFGYID